MLNVIRMIKLFGWENKMNEKLSVKRNEELAMQKKRQLLELVTSMVKSVAHASRLYPFY